MSRYNEYCVDCFCRFLYQFLTSEELVIGFSNSKLFVKTLFQIMSL